MQKPNSSYEPRSGNIFAVAETFPLSITKLAPISPLVTIPTLSEWNRADLAAMVRLNCEKICQKIMERRLTVGDRDPSRLFRIYVQRQDASLKPVVTNSESAYKDETVSLDRCKEASDTTWSTRQKLHEPDEVVAHEK